jgi:hypothetical protein
MGERRVLYGVFSLRTTKGTATATNTIFVDGPPNGEDRLTLPEIRQAERTMVAECRLTNPDIASAMLVWWAWLRSDEGTNPPLALAEQEKGDA